MSKSGEPETELFERTRTRDPSTVDERGTRHTNFSDDAAPRVDPGAAHPSDVAFEHRYDPKGVLGRGGMGEVLLCADKHIGRDVALKAMHAVKRDSFEARARFLREACIQGQLEHPGIVPIYDLGSAPGIGVFFTMKQIRGVTLREVIERLAARDPVFTQQYSRAKLLAAFQQLCLALDFAHARGVVHRDLKPGNVMLGSFGEVYVLDWGLAKVRNESSDEPVRPPPTAETLDGTVLGTPGYMAPEQQLGGSSTADPRADIYALGAMLFEILTLEPLVPRAERRGRAAPSDARTSVRAPHREVPPELEAICVRATALDPAARQASAREVAEAIERFLDGDRDLELRRALAKRQAEQAAAAVARALEASADEETARATAMREVTHALALDAENVDARRALVELLLHPPRRLPKQVENELEEMERATIKISARTGAIGISMFLLFAPAVLWMGLLETTTAVLGLIALFGLAVLGVLGLKPSGPPPAGRAFVLFFGFAFLLVASRLMGSLILIPSLLAAFMAPFVFNADDVLGRRIVAAALFVLLAPFLLELAGVLPPSYMFDERGLHVVPNLALLPRVATLSAMLVTAISTLFVPWLLLRRVRRQLDDAQRQLRLQAWYLKTIIASAPPREGAAA